MVKLLNSLGTTFITHVSLYNVYLCIMYNNINIAIYDNPLKKFLANY